MWQSYLKRLGRAMEHKATMDQMYGSVVMTVGFASAFL